MTNGPPTRNPAFMHSPEHGLFIKLSGFVFLLLVTVGAAYVTVAAYTQED